MPRYLSLVLTNPAPGREDEFNDWYTHVHIPDVLAVPGIVAATRYRLAGRRGGDLWGDYRYMAIYELDTDDLRGLFRELVARLGTPAMPLSDAMAEQRAFYDWEVIMPTLQAARGRHTTPMEGPAP